MGIQDEVLKVEVAEGLNRALDNNFERVRDKARREWEHRFGHNDPSDACVSVRIHSASGATLSALPAAGFLARKARPQTGKMRPLLV